MVKDFHPSARAFVDCLVNRREVADNLDAGVELDVTGCVVVSVGDLLEMTWLWRRSSEEITVASAQVGLLAGLAWVVLSFTFVRSGRLPGRLASEGNPRLVRSSS